MEILTQRFGTFCKSKTNQKINTRPQSRAAEIMSLLKLSVTEVLFAIL